MKLTRCKLSDGKDNSNNTNNWIPIPSNAALKRLQGGLNHLVTVVAPAGGKIRVPLYRCSLLVSRAPPTCYASAAAVSLLDIVYK